MMNLIGAIGTVLGAVIAVVASVATTVMQTRAERAIDRRTLRREEYYRAIHIISRINIILRQFPDVATPDTEASSGTNSHGMKERDKFGVQLVNALFDAKNDLQEEKIRLDMVANRDVSSALERYFDTIEEYFKKLLEARDEVTNTIKFGGKDFQALSQKLNQQREHFVSEMREDIGA